MMGLASLAVAAAMAVPPPDASSLLYELDLPAQELDESLQTLALISRHRLLYSSNLVEGRTAPALRGQYSAEQAIETLLSGTDLDFEVTPDGLVLIRRKQEPANSPPRPEAGRPGAFRRMPDAGRLVTARAESSPRAHSASADEPDAGELQPQVIVTGSRIVQHTSMVTPTPVTAVTTREIQRFAPPTLIEGLMLLPQFANNNSAVGNADSTSGPAGASNLNLRGIGANRTLVLLDGRRIVPSTRKGLVDISLLPESLIQRVEVVTGGASAAYGSDAVSGVANFILDTDFSGVTATLQAGTTRRSDNDNYKASVAVGAGFGEKLHITGSLEYFDSDGIQGYEKRDWFQSWGNIRNPDPSGPAEIMVNGLRWRSYTQGGVITGGPLAGIQFLEGGVPAPFYPGSIVSTHYQQGGSGYDEGLISPWILPDQRRSNAFLHGKYQPSEATQLLGQVLVGDSRTSFTAPPSATYVSAPATIYRDNAFLPESIRQRMIDEDIESFPLGRMSRDIGEPSVENRSVMLSLTGGFKSGLANGWHLEGYYQYGRNEESRDFGGVVRLDRLWRAIDSVIGPVSGMPVCRSTLAFADDGCVPLNLFGPGAPSQEARRYLLTDFSVKQTVHQHAAEVSLSGHAFHTWAGPLGLATGASYRRETIGMQVLPTDLAALRVLPSEQFNYRGIPPRDLNNGIFERLNYASTQWGAYDVREGFAEVLVPLASDVPFARALDLDIAGRYADYSGSGGIWAWKAGLDWQLIDDVRVRATRSRDVRAGNLAERFGTATSSGFFERDPVNPDLAVYSIFQMDGGNPRVEPEAAETLTYGIVFTPRRFRGLNVSVDYYDIRIRDAISQLGVQKILDECFAGVQSLCDVIQRDPATSRLITVSNLYLNVAEARTRGVDIEVALQRPVRLFGGSESLTVRGFANHALEISTRNAGAEKVDRVGQTGRSRALEAIAPEWRVNLMLSYDNGPWSIHGQQLFVSSGTRNATHRSGVQIDDNRVAKGWITNIGVEYDRVAFGSRLQVFGVVNNLMDADPPRAAYADPFDSVHTNEELFDPLGRRYVVGVRLKY
jgi:iron complex outermembrane receptor protein